MFSDEHYYVNFGKPSPAPVDWNAESLRLNEHLKNLRENLPQLKLKLQRLTREDRTFAKLNPEE